MPKCILCEANAIVNKQDNASRSIYNCQHCGIFVVSDLVINDVKKNAQELAAYLTHRKISGEDGIPLLSFNGAVKDKAYTQLTVGQIAESFPRSFSERMDRALQNLVLMSYYHGDEIKIDSIDDFATLYVLRKNLDAVSFMLKSLQNAGYITTNYGSSAFFPCSIVVSPAGWHRLDSISSGECEDNMLVLAPGDEDGGEAYTGQAKSACGSCGYRFTGGFSKDDMLDYTFIAKVKAAKVVLCDLSSSAPQAYYAAGMARALGKTVLLTCLEEKRDSLTLNPAQISVILYKDANDVSQLIINAIEALDRI